MSTNDNTTPKTNDSNPSKTNDTTTPKTNDSTTNDTTTSETYYVPPTPPNPRLNQRTLNSRNNRRNRHDNSTYGILQDDEYYKERGNFWTSLSRESIERRIRNDDWDDMNSGEAQEALDQM
ncbi:hypothetical protein F8M41_016746 [Gigaspora margarita]|uniref:Uncharacterized protein n=1 Tax=Gigaspora margarita TaxID=4874 RepID=A0A8H4EUD6_GIGMA|nr:hypothetical protein F8M41_016746 [Gigaspora margarita]